MAWTKTEKEWLDERLSGIEGRLNARMDSMEAKQDQTLEQVIRTNGRVTSLERSRTWTKGWAVGFGIIVGSFIFLVAWIGKEVVYEVKENSEFRIQHQSQQVK